MILLFVRSPNLSAEHGHLTQKLDTGAHSWYNPAEYSAWLSVLATEWAVGPGIGKMSGYGLAAFRS
jgi:hypothetical protein